MSPAPIGVVGGVTILGSSMAQWTLTEGVRPSTATVDIDAGDVDRLLRTFPSPITLTLFVGSAQLDYQFLYALQQVAAESPQIARVQLVDQRYFWTTRQMRAGFNVRRKTGIRYFTAPNAISGPRQVIPTIAYAPWSLRGSEGAVGTTTWRAVDILEEIKKRIADTVESATGQAPPDPEIAPSASFAVRQLPVEDLFLHGDVATCVAQMMDYFPGIGLFIRADGTPVFFSKAAGDDADMVKALGPEKVGAGHVEPMLSLRNVRPKRIEVCFLRECELRFDFNEGGTTSEDGRYLENVLPIPDFTLTVGSETLAQGTWITIQQALTAWNADGGLPLLKGTRPLTLNDVQRACIPENGIAEAIGILGIASPTANWTARIATLLAHYRRTYRINKRWMDRIFQLKASRVAMQNFTTGARADSPIYSDYAYLGTMRSLYRDRLNKTLNYVNNQPIFSGGNISATQIAAPGRVVIVDHDQGILRFEFLGDPAGVYQTVFPSQIVSRRDESSGPGHAISGGGGPTGDVTNRRVNIAWGILSDPANVLQLMPNHRAATIVTAMPGLGAQGLQIDEKAGQFHIESVSPTDHGVGDFAGSNECKGPVLQVFITPGLDTALVPWFDDTDKSAAIEACFGPPFTSSTDAASFTLNAPVGTGGGKGNPGAVGASLREMALAAAARIWHSLADRAQGSTSGTLVPSIEPRGWIEGVTHALLPSGEASTAISIADRVEPFDLVAYLPPGVRWTILRLVDPGG